MENKDSQEKSSDVSSATSTHEKSPAPKSSPEKSSKSSEEGKNRGWPKGKKRYPKSPGAPKQPLSGYVHFLNDRRETVRKENPELSFADISKKLAVEWGQVDAKLKQDYTERAEADKERYNKAFAEYQLTDDYKQFVESQKKKEKEAGNTSAKRPSKEQTRYEIGFRVWGADPFAKLCE